MAKVEAGRTVRIIAGETRRNGWISEVKDFENTTEAKGSGPRWGYPRKQLT